MQNSDSRGKPKIQISPKELQVCIKSMLDNNLMICLASGLVLQREGEKDGADWSHQEDKYLLLLINCLFIWMV